MNTDGIRVRFAPSPTGHLHVGGLRTAIFNWLFARHYKGIFLLRMEDTDVERSTTAYCDSILASLAWTGLQPDEPMVSQSERIQEHNKVLMQLLKNGKAYRCFCSPEDLIARYGKKTDNFFVRYDGYCRDRTKQQDNQKSFVVRFALPENQSTISFDDLIRGSITFSLSELDDFIIARSDGRPMYNFAVVVDDAFMKISHVIRGEDHIANTPKQILLYQACHYSIPQFAHLPLILGPSGDRLSKRDGALSVLEYKKEGYLAHALINYLVRLGWAYGDQEIFSEAELIQYFSLDNVGKKGAIFDAEKLLWVNSVYIKNMSSTQLIAHVINDVEPNFLLELAPWSDLQVDEAINLYKERVKTLYELVEELLLLHTGPQKFQLNELKKWINQDTVDQIKAIIVTLEKQTVFTSVTIISAMKELTKKIDVKLIKLTQPIRIALIGKISGPGVFGLLGVVGKIEAIRRLQVLLDNVQQIQ
ncbi:MAG: glutamate--tRNA ligase [Candidatus Babeliales bacterium]